MVLIIFFWKYLLCVWTPLPNYILGMLVQLELLHPNFCSPQVLNILNVHIDMSLASIPIIVSTPNAVTIGVSVGCAILFIIILSLLFVIIWRRRVASVRSTEFSELVM